MNPGLIVSLGIISLGDVSTACCRVCRIPQPENELFAPSSRLSHDTFYSVAIGELGSGPWRHSLRVVLALVFPYSHV